MNLLGREVNRTVCVGGCFGRQAFLRACKVALAFNDLVDDCLKIHYSSLLPFSVVLSHSPRFGPRRGIAPCSETRANLSLAFRRS